MTVAPVPVTNEPAPSVPNAFTEGLSRIGGMSPTRQPRLRLVWGQDLRERINGELVFRYSYGSVLTGWTITRYGSDGKIKSASYHAGPARPSGYSNIGTPAGPAADASGRRRMQC